MLLDAGGNRQDIGIEDDVFGIKSDLIHQQTVGAGADADLLILGGCLSLLVKGHDDHGSTVALGQTGALQEGLLAILEADGVEDAFPLNALHPLLKNRPLGAVDHDRNAADLRVGHQQMKEGLHDHLAVEHPLIDIHIEDIGTAFDLLARHRQGRLVITGNDELREPGRTGDIGPLADHHKGTSLPDSQGLS